MSRMHPRRWVGLASFTLALTACNSDSGPVGSLPDAPTSPGPASALGRVVLEVELARNVPFLTIHWRSLVVDREGNVTLHDRSEDEWRPCAPFSQVGWGACPEAVYSATDIDGRLASGRVVGRIDPVELARRLDAVANVTEGGPFQTPNLACNDTGVFTYLVYRFEPPTDTYRIAPLRYEGEILRQNLGSGARDTAVWLRGRMLELDPDIMGRLWSRAIRDACVPEGPSG